MNGGLCATGVVSLVMVMNLRRFVRFDDGHAYGPLAWRKAKLSTTQPPSSVESFERLRGSKALADFLKNHLHPGHSFRLDGDELRVETSLAIVEPSLVEDETLKEHLKAWTFKLRLTRNGMAVVKLERSLDQVHFSAISEMIQETQRFLPTRNLPDGVRVPTQWQLAMDVVALFVRACNYHVWRIRSKSSRIVLWCRRSPANRSRVCSRWRPG